MEGQENPNSEIVNLEAELERELTDEDRDNYKKGVLKRLNDAVFGIAKFRTDRPTSPSTVELGKLQQELDEINGLTPQELDWRYKRQIRDQIELLRGKK